MLAHAEAVVHVGAGRRLILRRRGTKSSQRLGGRRPPLGNPSLVKAGLGGFIERPASHHLPDSAATGPQSSVSWADVDGLFVAARDTPPSHGDFQRLHRILLPLRLSTLSEPARLPPDFARHSGNLQQLFPRPLSRDTDLGLDTAPAGAAAALDRR